MCRAMYICPQSAADDTQAEDEAQIEVDLGKIELGTLTEGGGHKQSNACCLYGKTHSFNLRLPLVFVKQNIPKSVPNRETHTHTNSTWYGLYQFEGKHKFETHYLQKQIFSISVD